MSPGVWYAVIAYSFWGFFPLYWKWLEGVPALQTVSHRSLWSCVVLVVLITVTGKAGAVWRAAKSPRALGIYAAAALSVAVNWFVYIWAVNAGFVVQTALGYFINPLVSVLLGVIVLRERLRRFQWAAIGVAAAGVVYLTYVSGALPWIALALAASFGTYGFLKKTAPLDALQGLTLETGILFIPAFVYLVYENHMGRGAFLHTGTASTILMMGAGPVTTLPLLLFAAASRRIPLSMMGMLQYINPTLQFLIGVFLYKEPFSGAQLVGFTLVWAALVMFASEGYVTHRWYAVEETP